MNNIILYTQNGCPKCKVLGKLLEKENIKFDSKIDIEFLKDNGFTSTPILSVDGKLMEFGEAVNWIKSK